MAIVKLKKIDLKDENKGINAVSVDMYFKTVVGIVSVQNCGIVIQIINRHIKNYERSIKKIWEQYQDN